MSVTKFEKNMCDQKNFNQKVSRPSWSTPGKSLRLPLAVRWLDQPPTLQLQSSSSHNIQLCAALCKKILVRKALDKAEFRL